MKKSTITKATDRERRRELTRLRRERKAAVTAAWRELTALKKQADKIVARHREADAILRRRQQIVESRLNS